MLSNKSMFYRARMGPPKGKKGPKGGAKRHISKVKRSNQKMNKMVKAGKAKPKSQPRYIPKSKKAEKKGEKETWLTPEVRKKWQDNLEQQFEVIRNILDEYPYVGMDTEFPGVVARPIGQFTGNADYHYQTLRCNCDLLKIIQLVRARVSCARRRTRRRAAAALLCAETSRELPPCCAVPCRA